MAPYPWDDGLDEGVRSKGGRTLRNRRHSRRAGEDDEGDGQQTRGIESHQVHDAQRVAAQLRGTCRRRSLKTNTATAGRGPGGAVGSRRLWSRRARAARSSLELRPSAASTTPGSGVPGSGRRAGCGAQRPASQAVPCWYSALDSGVLSNTIVLLSCAPTRFRLLARKRTSAGY